MNAIARRIAPSALALAALFALPSAGRAGDVFLPPISAERAALRVAPDTDSADRPVLTYASAEAGTLTIELFDAKGKRIAGETREVVEGEHGCWKLRTLHPGPKSKSATYRALLWTTDGRMKTATGRVND